MYCLDEQERALALYNEAACEQKKYAQAAHDAAAINGALRHSRASHAPLPTTPESPRPKRMTVRLEFVVRFEQGDDQPHPEE